MAVYNHPAGGRAVSVSITVPGAAEQVWGAIATGPGISSWFVPTEFEFGPDGAPARLISHFSPDGSMDSVAAVLTWDPPRCFRAASADLGPDAPEVITEWRVAPVSGSTARVDVTHIIATDTNDWDAQLEQWEGGWPWFFQILRLYLGEFPGQPCVAFRAMGAAAPPADAAWEAFANTLGIAGAEPGARRAAPPELPPMRGRMAHVANEEGDYGVVLRLDDPCAGILSTFALPMGDQVYLVLDFFFYGTQAVAAAERWAPRWKGWMQSRYPMPAAPPGS